MSLEFITERLNANPSADAIAWNGKIYSYAWLNDKIQYYTKVFESKGITSGSVVLLEADYSPNSIAMFFSLTLSNAIIVPLHQTSKNKKEEFLEIASIEFKIEIDKNDDFKIQKIQRPPSTAPTTTPPLIKKLKDCQHTGLILFSSGSSGANKGIVHDLHLLLEKYKVEGKSKRITAFLLFDHIGGINTLLYTLLNGGCLILLDDRSPATVCKAIENFKAEVLAASPTFLNLLLLSEVYKNFNLNSLSTITYGSEAMPPGLLNRCHKLFPQIQLIQKYGLTEVGILKSKSKGTDSLWIVIDPKECQTRIVNGLLEIKTPMAMLGYLNAPSPFTKDGWFQTGDVVETDGEWIKILGRESDIINIGGEKVFPIEIENILRDMPGIEDVVVIGESNIILGTIVKARFFLTTNETIESLRSRMTQYCANKLSSYKIPQKVEISTEPLHSERLKKIRKG